MLVAERYRLGELLGRGGMGEVRQGYDEVLGRQVAVKLLLGDGDEAAAGRFRLEAQTAARLNHPHVVGVYDFGAWDGRFYLVMELVRGPSLAQELAARGALSPRRVARVAAEAAAGLAAAHRQGVVHRDVKPGNLMLDADGALKIGDFGIARFVDETSAGLTRAGQIVGTSTYLAPERALGRVAGPPSDVYALGCVLYHLLTGQPPFWSENPTNLLYLHVDEEPVPARRHRVDLPGAFDAYLLRMLAKEPADRPTAEEAAAWFGSRAWEGAVAEPASSAGPFGAPAAGPVVPPMPVTPPRPSVPPTAGARRGRPRAHGRAGTDLRAALSGGLWPPKAVLRRPKAMVTTVAGLVAFGIAAAVGAALSGTDGGGGGGLPGGGPHAVPADAAVPSPEADAGHGKHKDKGKSKGKDGQDGKGADGGGRSYPKEQAERDPGSGG
ncbi:serine/threonine-protein kinase [Streptomyces gamaensis]|uniref:non-specific serine/threonine protein kinase n=1 Tax=Streptomyces gamaensis TaxID=1763542 RepID=A0ABW0Z586_9ACTN